MSGPESSVRAAGPAAGDASPLARVARRLQHFAERLGKQPHLLSIRDGVIGALPLLLVSSFFLLLAQPPSATLTRLVAPHLETLILPYRMLGGVLALYVCFGTAYALAKRYTLDALGCALSAVAAYLCALSPVKLAPPASGWGLPGDRLGPSGLFAALLIAILTVELTRLFARRNWTIRLPGSAPEVVIRSFAALIPTFVIILLVWLVVHVLGIDVVGLIAWLVAPLVRASDSLPAAWLIILVDSGMWILGLHASAVMAPLRAIWAQMITENMNAPTLGLVPPHVGVQEMFTCFVWQGGSGGTLAVALWLVFRARSATLRGIGKAGIVPALFNINEPILFGVPVVLNGTLAIPFLLAPLSTATLTWCAFHFNLLVRPHFEVIWTVPAPFGAIWTTGDVRAGVLALFNLLLSLLIYSPFLSRYDRHLLAREQSQPPATPQ